MSAIPLFLQDGTAAGVWYCSQCKRVYEQETMAHDCHEPRVCGTCGDALSSMERGDCAKCRNAKWKEESDKREAEKFEKAQKIAAADWSGWVFCDGSGPNYFESVDEFLEYAENDYADPSHVPVYVWAAEDRGIKAASIQDIIESVIESMWEDADSSDLHGVEELDTAIREFNKANEGLSVYYPNYSKAMGVIYLTT